MLEVLECKVPGTETNKQVKLKILHILNIPNMILHISMQTVCMIAFWIPLTKDCKAGLSNLYTGHKTEIFDTGIQYELYNQQLI